MDIIDTAFYRVLQECSEENNEERPTKRQKASLEPEEAGGFLLDEEEDSMSINSGGQTADELPLFLVPRALQLLDLPPEDTELMEVFKSAAYQRKADQNSVLGDKSYERDIVISKGDWRKVCSTLLLDGDNNIESSESNTSSSSGPGVDSDDSADDYIVETPKKKNSGRGPTTRQPRKQKMDYSKGALGKGADRMGVTERQKEDALSTFALFFHDSTAYENGDLSVQELTQRRITIEDVAKAAKSIKEKISADEVRQRTIPSLRD